MNVYSMEMTAVRRFRQTSGQKRCPECGDKMIEIDRCSEGGVLFVWHKCGRDNCNGQWLQKIPQKFHDSPVSDVSQ